MKNILATIRLHIFARDVDLHHIRANYRDISAQLAESRREQQGAS